MHDATSISLEKDNYLKGIDKITGRHGNKVNPDTSDSFLSAILAKRYIRQKSQPYT
jgi:hypothetical protein